MNRKFRANALNEKWVTDVTEFKWYEGLTVHKLYLSAIRDLRDRRIVSYMLRDSNDNKLVFDTFDLAIESCPDAKPIFHSERGCQYINNFLVDHGITQSMSRVVHCIDNGLWKGFWGILKRVMLRKTLYFQRRAGVND